jgi:hypothetical protein
MHSSLPTGSQEVSEVYKTAIELAGNSTASNSMTSAYHNGETSWGGRPSVLHIEPNSATTSRDAETATRGQEAQPADAETYPQRKSEPKASSAPVTFDRTLKRSRPRQASNKIERRGLAVVTLRRIEFPDGRRITQLIPYGIGDPSSP